MCVKKIIYFFIISLSLIYCGAEGGKEEFDADIISDIPIIDISKEDGFIPKLVAKIKVDKFQGNAPLILNLEGIVQGAKDEELKFKWDFGNGSYSDKKSPGKFVYSYGGLYKITFTVTHTLSDVHAEDSVEIVVFESAELILSPVSITSATEIAPGDIITLKFSLYNKGDVIKEKFRVSAYISKDEIFSKENDKEIASYYVSGMDDGRFTEVKMDFNDVKAKIPDDTPLGSYYVFVMADPDEIVNESNENNNLKMALSYLQIKKLQKEKPDLVSTFITFPKDITLAQKGVLNYQYGIKNIGEGDAKNFKFAIYASKDLGLDENDYQLSDDATSSIYQMKKGGEITITRSVMLPENMEEGEYHLIGFIDSKKEISEIDEDNNVIISVETFKLKYIVIEGFDLFLKEVNVSPKDTYWGGSIKVEMKILNDGNKPTPPYLLSIFISEEDKLNPNYDTKLKEEKKGSIPAKEEASVEEIVPIAKNIKQGKYYIHALLDMKNELDELEEGNNWNYFKEQIWVFKEAFVEISLGDIYVHPMIVNAGNYVKVNYIIKNAGSTTSGAFVNYIVLSEDKNISVSEVKSKKDFLISTASMGGIPAGSSIERVEKTNIPLALPHTISSYYLGVIGDAENNIPSDKNKNDNVIVTNEPVIVIEPKGGCFEDSYEPNNIMDQSVSINEGSLEKLGLCSAEDWFRIDVQKGYSLLIILKSEAPLSLEPKPYDLDLELYNKEGKIIQKSEKTGSIESIQVLISEKDESYYIRVKPKVAGTQSHYTLEVDIIPPVSGIDLIPYNVEVFPQAIYPGGIIKAFYKIANLGSIDSKNIDVALYLTKNDKVEPEDIKISEGVVESIKSTSTLEKEDMIILPLEVAGGDYYVALALDEKNKIIEENENNNISLSGIVHIDDTLSCKDDEFEPNNDIEIATKLETKSGVFQNLKVCPGLDDWYKIDIPEGVSFSVSVNYAHDNKKGYINLELYDETKSALIDLSLSQIMPVVGIPYIFESGTYYVRIYNAPQGGKIAPYDYSLGLSITDPNPSDVCKKDVHEPNNSFASAENLPCGENKLTLCKKDVDYFIASLLKGELLIVNLFHKDQQLKLSVYEDILASAVKSIAGNGSIDYIAKEDINLYILVEVKSKTLNLTDFNYSLSADGIAGIDLTITSFSIFPEEVYQGEDVIADFELKNQCIGTAEKVYYKIFLSEDMNLDIQDVVVLSDSLPTQLQGKGIRNVSTKVTIPFETKPSKYYLILKVDPQNIIQESQEDNNVFSTSLSVLKFCLEDLLEPNDFYSIAKEIKVGKYSDLSICPNDFDWYLFSAKKDKNYTITLEFKNSEGDIDLRLYKKENPLVPFLISATKEDKEVIKFKATKDEKFYIRVNGFYGETNKYNLTLEEM